ncbi:MAG: lysine--tRNA ligase, partial [Rhizobiales bacterium]|nr:lysine--tRNA ligase [Hyphomicrobiales bacterium]
HDGNPPPVEMPVAFAMLLNLAAASNAHDRSTLWGFILRHVPGVTPESHPKLDEMAGYAVRYYEDFVAPKKVFRAPDAEERAALEALDAALARLEADGVTDGGDIQNAVYEVGRSFERFQDKAKTGPDGRPGVALTWFETLYQVLLGMERGPRFGSFVAIYGIPETRALIGKALGGELVA